jgi:microcystin-dependent protein/CheY-like chemotaxis protein
MKLLIVEDSISVRRLLRTLVAPLAEQIDECGDGIDAVSLYEIMRPDFVLMDVDLERMDGITATRKIIAVDANAKVIIVTNYDENDVRDEAKKAGAFGYVLKENLLDLLELLQTHSQRLEEKLKQMDANQYMGEIRMFAGKKIPDGWIECDGRRLSMITYRELYDLIGDRFGGDQLSYFNVPDLRGRMPISFGQGKGLSNQVLGEQAGRERVTLSVEELPRHTHNARVSNVNGTSDSPAGASWAKAGRSAIYNDQLGLPTVNMSASAIGSSGKGGPHENMPPFLALNYIIALTGDKPLG